MPALTTSLLPSKLNPHSLSRHPSSVFLYTTSTSSNKNNHYSIVSRLYGPAIFEESKLRVIFSGVDEKMHPAKLPRTYTLTHCDITSKLTLAISQTINNSQVLKAFVHGDVKLLRNYPELEEALVWVYFHSNIPQYNKVECWGPLKDAPVKIGKEKQEGRAPSTNWERIPQSCEGPCYCCFTPMSFINWDPQGGPSGTHKNLTTADMKT
ncbi:hypothetical protein LguiA_034243 [Lonicera macranthoides]